MVPICTLCSCTEWRWGGICSLGQLLCLLYVQFCLPWSKSVSCPDLEQWDSHILHEASLLQQLCWGWRFECGNLLERKSKKWQPNAKSWKLHCWQAPVGVCGGEANRFYLHCLLAVFLQTVCIVIRDSRPPNAILNSVEVQDAVTYLPVLTGTTNRSPANSLVNRRRTGCRVCHD